MKNLFTTIVLLICFISFSQERITETKLTPEQLEKYKKANVIETRGLLMFVNAIPAEKYTIIGEVAMNLIDSRKYTDQIYVIINKIKKQYPDAYAVIINTEESRFTAEIITFNELK
jgi:hypothetical protein